ncbi:MAG: GAF domain-containing protein [Bradyrhizobium sp.]|uniref:adenylate/guanylate cyclase domain-containing protein n=1 Tax=Bradyrhizobium sp. TaxID=376 RepID=UPI001D937477|nr:adenylate/guanylate cyclase domain-containing protein [Bradyrhizobium sp.]MBV9563787.1 GAF domain-containing protein [Bradyrhizobium sp.]
MSFPIPADEAQRLVALRALDILDSAPEIAYDEIAELAAQICNCPVAFISFIDSDRRWIKAKYGLPAEVVEAPRRVAACSTTICGTELLVVPDMTKDPRFDHSPIVVGSPYCRFYCGMPLITDEGHALGALCVMDFEPRQLNCEQRESLRRLSRQVLTQLKLRGQLIEHGRTIEELDRARIEAASEKARAEQLLDNVLPASVADELKKSGRVQPKYTPSATILFADFQGFTLLAERMDPAPLVDLLDQYFTAFDEIVARHGLEKVKTIGDAYMAVGGVLDTDRRHPIDGCLAALEMKATVAAINSRREKLQLPALELRVGIHTGPVVSAVIGSQRFTFDIWGEAVNKASFMETHCPPARINISEDTARRVEPFFELEARGLVEVKHERKHRMYFLNRLRSECRKVGRPLGEDHPSGSAASRIAPHPDIMARRARLRA